VLWVRRVKEDEAVDNNHTFKNAEGVGQVLGIIVPQHSETEKETDTVALVIA